MTDDLIVRLAKSIAEAATEQDVLVSGNTRVTFADWKHKWEAHPVHAGDGQAAAR